jgi:hypothetical protein
MGKLIVKLPGLRKSNRIENIKEINGQQKKTFLKDLEVLLTHRIYIF